MLFLGTEKYPKDGEYQKYLGEHGGSSNAFTLPEYTTYYFQVASPHLGGALDRFSQFFVAPTFDSSCVQREMNAVDSESTNYSTEDTWRFLQVLKKTASEEHPFYRFDVGNLETLNKTTRDDLISWNQQFYQAGAMRLAVVGRDSLDDLEQLTVEQFGAVRSGTGETADHRQSLPWPESRLGRIYSCVPLKESRSISVAWPLPPADEHLFRKPELYLSHILGHEGPGSLHDVLNERGWVDQLSAGPSQSFTDSQLFAVNISLTPEGDANREEVLSLLFQYVELFKQTGPQEDIFRELVALQEIGFAHKEDSPTPDSLATSTAMSLHKYPPEDVIRGPFAMDEWKPELIREYLSMLRADRCIVFFASSAFKDEVQTDGHLADGWKFEEWYRAPFKEESIGDARLKLWQTSAKEGSGLQMPEPNRFIPQDFTLRGAACDAGSKLPMEVTPPTPLQSSPLTRLWHKVDSTYKTPREYVLAQIHMLAYEAGPEVVVMMRLFCGIVYDDLNSFSYAASVAGLSYSVDFSDSLSLSVSGFNDKLPELLQVVLARMDEIVAVAASAENAPDDGDSGRAHELLQMLDIQRQLLLQDYSNFVVEEPWSVGGYYLSQLMLPGTWHLHDYIAVLEQPPSLRALAEGVQKALAKVQIEILVHGNASAEEASFAADAIGGALGSMGASVLPELPRRKVTKLPAGVTTVFEFDLAAENPAQENCCTQAIYQVGSCLEDYKRDACLSFACQVANTSAYQQLRTEEQLGYIVQAGWWSEAHVIGFSVLVQGTRLPPPEIDARIENWMSNFGRELAEMSDEDFSQIVQGMISERTQRCARLSQETSLHWGEIQPRRYQFDNLRRGVQALESLARADVLEFFDQYLAASSSQRRKLSMRVLGTSAGASRSEPEADGGRVLSTLEDLRSFRESSEVFLAPAPQEMPTA